MAVDTQVAGTVAEVVDTAVVADKRLLEGNTEADTLVEHPGGHLEEVPAEPSAEVAVVGIGVVPVGIGSAAEAAAAAEVVAAAG